jgi:hypothetical protein
VRVPVAHNIAIGAGQMCSSGIPRTSNATNTNADRNVDGISIDSVTKILN